MCEIVIDSERLKHFPKTVPMNIREAILVVAQILIRIHMEQATKTASLECGQKEAITEPASAPVQENKTPPPAKRHGPHAEIIFMKSRSPKKAVS
jgi:hypothetical protein